MTTLKNTHNAFWCTTSTVIKHYRWDLVTRRCNFITAVSKGKCILMHLKESMLHHVFIAHYELIVEVRIGSHNVLYCQGRQIGDKLTFTSCNLTLCPPQFKFKQADKWRFLASKIIQIYSINWLIPETLHLSIGGQQWEGTRLVLASSCSVALAAAAGEITLYS